MLQKSIDPLFERLSQPPFEAFDFVFLSSPVPCHVKRLYAFQLFLLSVVCGLQQ